MAMDELALAERRRRSVRAGLCCLVVLALSLIVTQFGSGGGAQATVPAGEDGAVPSIGFEPAAPLPTAPSTTETTGESTTTQTQPPSTVQTSTSETTTVESDAAGGPEGVVAVEGVGLIAGWEAVACDGSPDGGVLRYRLFISDGKTIERERVDPAGSHSIEADPDWGPLPSAIFWTVTGTTESGFACQFA